MARRIIRADEKLKELWGRYGEWTLILTRAVPVLAEAAVLFAGMTAMPFRRLPRTSGLDTPCFAPGESAPIGEN